MSHESFTKTRATLQSESTSGSSPPRGPAVAFPASPFPSPRDNGGALAEERRGQHDPLRLVLEETKPLVEVSPALEKELSAATTAAIVTCGGICPGLNTVVRELVRRRHRQDESRDGAGKEALLLPLCRFVPFTPCSLSSCWLPWFWTGVSSPADGVFSVANSGSQSVGFARADRGTASLACACPFPVPPPACLLPAIRP